MSLESLSRSMASGLQRLRTTT